MARALGEEPLHHQSSLDLTEGTQSIFALREPQKAAEEKGEVSKEVAKKEEPLPEVKRVSRNLRPIQKGERVGL